MKKKILLIIVSTILVALVATLAFAGNFLLKYALIVDENGKLGSMSSEYTGVQDTQAQRDFDQWVSTIKQTELTLTNKDGLGLWAIHYMPATASDVYVLAVHGYTVDHRDIVPAVKPFVENGYNVIAIDQRGRGNSEGDFLSMGYYESYDVLEWIELINKLNPSAKIILYGESMGGATVLMAASRPLPNNVILTIEDCAFTSAYEMFEDQLSERFGLPAFPFLPAAQVMGKLTLGYDFGEANVLKAIESAKLPILFIHGGSDDYVPTWMGEALYTHYQGPKELLIVPNAGHGASADVDPVRYYTTVFDFINQYLK